MAKKRVNVITMGCSKNLVDSEVLLSQLERGGFEVVHDSDELGFDAVFINTCGFINDAKQESIDMILDYVEAKKRGDIERLYVFGCLSERYGSELESELPEVDRFFGKFALEAMVEELKVTFAPKCIFERKLTTPSHYAYLKISEGCNRCCAFCAIPKITGRHKSRSIESLIKEAKSLAARGVKELLLIAQDLSYYGIDLYNKNKLAELVTELSKIDEIKWIRLHYLYPTQFPMEILPIMRENPKVCKYLDLPLQHISNPVLKNMLRRVTREETEALLAKIKTEVPGVVIRTTMLVGFPGETEDDFNELVQFVEDNKFERLGVFAYSNEDGTYAANNFEDTLDDETKQARVDEIMEVQQSISLELNQEKKGKELKVIIDREEGDYYIGRTEFDSPEVDGEVFVSSEEMLSPGDFVMVKITDAEDYDLYGEVYERI